MHVHPRRTAVAPIPPLDSAIIVVLSVLLPFGCWLAIDRCAAPRDRPLVSSVTAIVLASWAVAGFALCIAGVFHPSAPKLIAGRSNAIPLLATGLLILLVLFL